MQRKKRKRLRMAISINRKTSNLEDKVFCLLDDVPYDELTERECETLIDMLEELKAVATDLIDKYSYGETLIDIEEREYWKNVLSQEKG